jgi:hypothetical protein
MLRKPTARHVALAATFVLAVMVVVPASALAAGPHPGMVVPGSILGSIFGGIGHTVLGAFTWTVKLASTFILDTIGALVKLLIPRSWAHKGAQIMGWIVAVPDYAGHVTTPAGQHQYGFAGINALRSVFVWLGMAMVPLTLTHATARAMVGDQEADPIGIPLLRIVLAGALILMYPYLWAQGAALADQITHVILSLPDVTSGLQKLMDYAVDGVALGGWQLIDLGLMGAIAIELLGLIFLKVVLILLGALLYATGPLTIGLVPTRFGHALARAWVSAVIFLLTIGVAWATIFAVGALLIQDAGTAGPLIGGHTAFGGMVGGLILAVAGLVSLWLCLKVAKEAGGMLRMQLGGLLALGALGGGSGSSAPSASAVRGRTTVSSLRGFGSRLSAGARDAGSELADAAPGGRQARLAMIGAGSVGRRGLAGTAAAGARYAGTHAAAPTAALLGRSRAGAVAVRAAKAGTAGYSNRSAGSTPTAPDAEAAATPRDIGQPSTARRSRKPRPGSARPASQDTNGRPSAASNPRGDRDRTSDGSSPSSLPAPSTPTSDGTPRGSTGEGRKSRASAVRPAAQDRPVPSAAPAITGASARSTDPQPRPAGGAENGRGGGTPPPVRRTTRPVPPPSRPAKNTTPDEDRTKDRPRPASGRDGRQTKPSPPPAPPARSPRPPRAEPPASDGSRQ